jgi:hypothetical protein
MNHCYQGEKELLIISPTPDDFSELKVQFKEPNAEVMYLAQITELSGNNSYDTFVFFNRDNKSYIFHEYENPETYGYQAKVEIATVEDYWKKLSQLDGQENGAFAKLAARVNDHKELDILLEKHQVIQNKKKKM